MAQKFTLAQMASSPISGTFTFYAAASSGGTVNVMNRVSVERGLIIAWSQTAITGTPAGWLFNDANNSGHAMLTWD